MYIKRPIFIVGMPRSGTTLLSTVLNVSNDIYIGQETHFFEVLAKWKKFGRKNSFFDFYFNNKSNVNLKYLTLDDKTDKLISLEKDRINKDPYILLFILCNHQSKGNDYKFWGEKTPGHYRSLPEIFQQYPSGIVFNILRDPRDVFVSQQKIDWGTKNPLKFSWDYRAYAQTCLKFKDFKGFVSLKFENLVEFSAFEITKISEVSKLEFNKDGLLDFHSKKYLNFDLKKEPWKKNNTNRLNLSNINKWKRNDRDKKIIFFISWLLKKELTKNNYDYVNNNSLLLNYWLYMKFLVRYIVTKTVNVITKLWK